MDIKKKKKKKKSAGEGINDGSRPKQNVLKQLFTLLVGLKMLLQAGWN